MMEFADKTNGPLLPKWLGDRPGRNTHRKLMSNALVTHTTSLRPG